MSARLTRGRAARFPVEAPAAAVGALAAMPRLLRAGLVPAARTRLVDALDLAAADLERIGMRVFVADVADGMLADAVPASPARIFGQLDRRRRDGRLPRPPDDGPRPRDRDFGRGKRRLQPRQAAGERERPHRGARLTVVRFTH